jgi:hypothetical protein
MRLDNFPTAHVPLKEEIYFKHLKLLNKTELKNFKQVNGRWHPIDLLGSAQNREWYGIYQRRY